MPKTVTNGQNQDFEPRFQGNYNTHNQTFEFYHKNLITSCYEKKFHEEI